METANLRLTLLGEMLIASPRSGRRFAHRLRDGVCGCVTPTPRQLGISCEELGMMVRIVMPVGHLVVLHLARCTVPFDVVMEPNFFSPNIARRRLPGSPH